MFFGPMLETGKLAVRTDRQIDYTHVFEMLDLLMILVAFEEGVEFCRSPGFVFGSVD